MSHKKSSVTMGHESNVFSFPFRSFNNLKSVNKSPADFYTKGGTFGSTESVETAT